MENLKDYVIDFIIDELECLKGYEVRCEDTYDLANILTEAINVTGSATCSTQKAKEYIKEWFNELEDFEEYYRGNIEGKQPYNPITQPEQYHCLMVIMGVEDVLLNIEYNTDLDIMEELEKTEMI